MASPVEAHLILCDHAVADPTGKIHMLGAGWTIVGTPTPPHGVAILVKIPWDRANEKIRMRLHLLDPDGKAVHEQDQDKPIEVTAELEAGRPPGVAKGSPLSSGLAVNVAPMNLTPGRYEWRLEIGETQYAEPFQVVDRRT